MKNSYTTPMPRYATINPVDELLGLRAVAAEPLESDTGAVDTDLVRRRFQIAHERFMRHTITETNFSFKPISEQPASASDDSSECLDSRQVSCDLDDEHGDKSCLPDLDNLLDFSSEDQDLFSTDPFAKPTDRDSVSSQMSFSDSLSHHSSSSEKLSSPVTRKADALNGFRLFSLSRWSAKTAPQKCNFAMTEFLNS